MYKRISLLLVLAFLLGACNRQNTLSVSPDTPLYIGQEIDFSTTMTRIALGSCNRQDLPQDMWQYIVENDPQLWVWLGDNIYGDTEDMEIMKRKYLQQKYGEEYTKLRTQVPVIGIWDDHDFGANDAGNEYPKRTEAQALMLDFLDVPKQADVRSQKGAYQSYTFGEPGKKVKVILLDSRYFRDKPIRNPNRPPAFLPNEEGTILGEAQWQWFEKELKNSDAQVHIIGNGIQVIPQDHNYEKWHNFPLERRRIFDLIAQHQVANPILVSGDRHIAEISKLEHEGATIYELTTSGLTHSYDKVGDEPNRHRVSKLIGKLNFGLIEIDWSSTQPEINLQIKGLKNTIHTEVEVAN